MLLSAWGDAFVELFTNSANIIAMVCLLIGMVLLCIECFVPGFGIFGISGIVFCAFSIVLTLILGGEHAWIQFLYMIAMIVVVLAVVILIAIRSARFGLLSKSSLIQNGVDLPPDYSSDEKNYSYLVGKTGVTKTILKPVGKAEIDEQTYQVTTEGEYIDMNEEIYVASVDGSTILVKKR
jgi:membrane-bound serine protease (ClpP class)